MSRPLIKHNEYKQYVTLKQISKMIYFEVYAGVVEVDTRYTVKNEGFLDELGSSSQWQSLQELHAGKACRATSTKMTHATRQ